MTHDNRKGSFRIMPCFQGVCVTSNLSSIAKLNQANFSSATSDAIYLPGNIGTDRLSPELGIPFASCFNLDQSDLANLNCTDPHNFAFTCYGPSSQDKASNQDFALAGSFENDLQGLSRFAVVADGISNGYCFAQRGAQISCFAAYECAKKFVGKLYREKLPLNENVVHEFRHVLAETINRYLQVDSDFIAQYCDEYLQSPPHIAPNVWEKYFLHNRKRWYGNTILLSILTPFGGIVAFAGDGAIVIRRGNQVAKDVLRTGEGNSIEQFVTLGFDSAMLRCGLLERESSIRSDDVLITTDGLDRSLCLNSISPMEFLNVENDAQAVVRKVCCLDQALSHKVDVDNYSFARINIVYGKRDRQRPPSAFAAQQNMATNFKSVDRQGLLDEQAKSSNDHTMANRPSSSAKYGGVLTSIPPKWTFLLGGRWKMFGVVLVLLTMLTLTLLTASQFIYGKFGFLIRPEGQSISQSLGGAVNDLDVKPDASNAVELENGAIIEVGD